METELRFASSPRRLSLRLRVRTAGFFLPSASFRPPLCRPLATCAFVYAFPSVVARISVWSGSGGFVVMTTNPGNPAALSHPLWLSRGSLSIRSPVSLLPACVFITILFYPHRRFSGPFTETFFFLFASPSLSRSTLQPRQFPPLACGFYARSRARVFALPYIYHVHAAYMYVCMRDSADCRPVHPPPRFCPWLLHPAVPVCEGGGPRSYATRDPRAGSSPRTTETEEKEDEEEDSATSSARKLEVQR